MKAAVPQISHNIEKNAFENAKNIFKRVQAKKGKVLEGYKKKPRHKKQRKKLSKECHKDLGSCDER